MKRKTDIFVSLLFFGCLAAMAVLMFLLPEKQFSESEKRYLAEKPVLTLENVLSGDFSSGAEDYAADHVPMRKFFIGLAANFDRLCGRQTTKSIYVSSDGRLFERPVVIDENELARRTGVISDFAESSGRTVYFMLIPSSGYIMRDHIGGLADSYRDSEIISAAYGFCSENVKTINLIPTFEILECREQLYYRTDHHWTSRGAFLGTQIFLNALGRSLPGEEFYTVSSFGGFYGTTYTRSSLWQYKAENVELWDSGANFTVTNSDAPDEIHEGVFYPERLSESDKYTVFLNGNHGTVRIENNSPRASGSLLLIRDSFGNCMGGFLAESYKTVVMIDLRYYKHPVSDLLSLEDFDDIAVIYGLGNFASDSSLFWLE